MVIILGAIIRIIELQLAVSIDEFLKLYHSRFIRNKFLLIIYTVCIVRGNGIFLLAHNPNCSSRLEVSGSLLPGLYVKTVTGNGISAGKGLSNFLNMLIPPFPRPLPENSIPRTTRALRQGPRFHVRGVGMYKTESCLLRLDTLSESLKFVRQK